MSKVKRDEAWLLHSMAWKETSAIVKVLTREHGIVTLVAKSAKRPYSVLRPILSAFTPLTIQWSGSAEIQTLRSADALGIMPIHGKDLMSAWYMNELLLYSVAKEDPCPRIFEIYTESLGLLCANQANQALRYFEWHLLADLGYGFHADDPDFDNDIVLEQWRMPLRQRIDQMLEQRRLRTRQILLDLNAIKREDVV